MQCIGGALLGRLAFGGAPSGALYSAVNPWERRPLRWVGDAELVSPLIILVDDLDCLVPLCHELERAYPGSGHLCVFPEVGLHGYEPLRRFWKSCGVDAVNFNDKFSLHRLLDEGGIIVVPTVDSHVDVIGRLAHEFSQKDFVCSALNSHFYLSVYNCEVQEDSISLRPALVKGH
ncbi:hypothetical protein A6E01_20310 (plasmid) [Vibrio breoganii]|uniref:Uncharacterized protein n=1 Tax=Vibrio breoganii TaxID=553239 RepID=A0AAN0XZV6_9VIBR|nr:hypothetical protein A6E01_20310 [Vibrio breoganii]PML15821.1 hypothetical protein BCT84_07405 [Vibrio breoganii]